MSRVKTLTGHTDAVRTLTIAGSKLFSGSYDGTLKVRRRAGWRGRVAGASSDGSCVVHVERASRRGSSGVDDTPPTTASPCQVWNTETLDCLATLTGHSGPVRTLVRCGNRVFSGSYDKTGEGGGGRRGARCGG